MFQCLVAGLKKNPGLGIHHLGFARGEAEEGRVEPAGIREARAAANEVISRVIAGRDADLVQLLVGEGLQAVDAVTEHAPQGVDIRSLGIAPGHADDGDLLQILKLGHGAAPSSDCQS